MLAKPSPSDRIALVATSRRPSASTPRSTVSITLIAAKGSTPRA